MTSASTRKKRLHDGHTTEPVCNGYIAGTTGTYGRIPDVKGDEETHRGKVEEHRPLPVLVGQDAVGKQRNRDAVDLRFRG